jgi:hypothetical protein
LIFILRENNTVKTLAGFPYIEVIKNICLKGTAPKYRYR